MEAVGAAASIAALADIALKSYGAASDLVKALYDAPKEFARLTQQLSILHCELSLLSEIERQAANSDELLLFPSEIDLLNQALTAANELLSNISEEVHSIKPQKDGSKARLRWALKGKSRTQELLNSLGHAEASLTNVLLLVNIRLSAFSCKVAASMRASQNSTAGQQNGRVSYPGQPIHGHLSFPQKALSSMLDRNPQTQNLFYGSWRLWKSSLLSKLGLQLLLTIYGNALHTTIFFSGNLSLWESPRAKAVFFNLGIRVFPLTNLGFSILRGGISAKSVVPEGSEIMMACKRGDTNTVRRLFVSRKASPYDVTRSNYGPLRFAIESGSLELVKFLCYYGADVNTTFGQFETSPLEWAFRARQIEVARFFLTQGACLDYLCYRGWTPVMLLFQKNFPEVPPEFFELLSCYAFTDFDVQDRYGTTALHRAALWGTERDVHALLQLGASPLFSDTDVGWTPVFGAASTNNTATLRRLADSMPPDFVHHVDFRGWTILHVAIEAGGLETMVLVLELGADPYHTLQISSNNRGVAEEITSYDFARSKGENTFQHFIKALQITGHSISTVEEVQKEERFWDAIEQRS